MGLFDFVKDPAGEIADSIEDGTEVVVGNIGKIAVAGVSGAVDAGKEIFRENGSRMVAGITIAVLTYAGFKMLQALYPPPPYNISKLYNP